MNVADQLAEIERSFGAMLQQLPGKTEIPNLLVDISQTGLAAGLEEKLFQPMSENRREFYAEKPIKIKLDGTIDLLKRMFLQKTQDIDCEAENMVSNEAQLCCICSQLLWQSSLLPLYSSTTSNHREGRQPTT